MLSPVVAIGRRSSERLDDGLDVRDDSDILQREVDGGAVPAAFIVEQQSSGTI